MEVAWENGDEWNEKNRLVSKRVDSPYRTKIPDTNKFSINLNTLPVDPEICVLKVVRGGDP